MSDEPRDPALEDVLQLVIETALANARTMLPARIESYSALKQSALIQVLVKEAHVDEAGERTVTAMPQIHDVPVWHFGGSSGRITVPVKVGDVGMAIFASSSIARHKLTGGHVDPGDDRHHDVNDCYFVPGGHSFANVPTTAPTDAIVLHGDSKIGGPIGTEPTLKADTFLTALDTLFAQVALAVEAAGLAATPADATAAAAIVTDAVVIFAGVVRAAYKSINAQVK